jgi:hypothetical protein
MNQGRENRIQKAFQTGGKNDASKGDDDCESGVLHQRYFSAGRCAVDGCEGLRRNSGYRKHG